MSDDGLGAPQPSDEQLHHVLASLQASLDSRRRPRAFSQQSVESMLECQAEFLSGLGHEAIRIADRAGNDEVQVVNVESADRVIRSDGLRRRHGAEVIGALLWGLSSATLLQELLAQDNAKMWLIGVSVVVLLLATGSVVYGLQGGRR